MDYSRVESITEFTSSVALFSKTRSRSSRNTENSAVNFQRSPYSYSGDISGKRSRGRGSGSRDGTTELFSSLFGFLAAYSSLVAVERNIRPSDIGNARRDDARNTAGLVRKSSGSILPSVSEILNWRRRGRRRCASAAGDPVAGKSKLLVAGVSLSAVMPAILGIPGERGRERV